MSVVVTSNDRQPASFYEWLGLQRHRTDPTGIVAVEAHRDPTFPRTAIQRLHTFLHYYREKPEFRDGIKIAHAEWRKYRASGKPRRFSTGSVHRDIKRGLQVSRSVENGPLPIRNTTDGGEQNSDIRRSGSNQRGGISITRIEDQVDGGK